MWKQGWYMRCRPCLFWCVGWGVCKVGDVGIEAPASRAQAFQTPACKPAAIACDHGLREKAFAGGVAWASAWLAAVFGSEKTALEFSASF